MTGSIRNVIKKIKDHPYRSLLFATIISILTGTLFYHWVEGLRWIDAVYFSVITLTTVGYGDFSPQTDAGKIFTIFYILNGIGIIFGFINAKYGRRSSLHKTQDL
jgi:voltage-gated potassium channel Kch